MESATQSIQSQAQMYLMGNYGRPDLCLVRGEGVYVWDMDGRRYVDCLSGLGVNNLGHCHPKVTAAIQKQAETLLHVSNLYLIEPQVKLAELLVQNSPADKAFFCNSGTEAVEAALKCARRYSFDKYGEGRHAIVSLEGSFHGRTMGALTATGQAKYHKGFQPLVPGMVHIPRHDVEALNQALDDTVCAFILEPVQGEGGVHPATVEYVQKARELCDKKDILLIFDEVQCGLGRSGHLFASEEFGVEPDLITLAKSLAGGVPIGALLAKDKAAAALTPGSHAATFGGNPLSCAAGIAALQTLMEERLPERGKELGEAFRARLKSMQENHACMQEIRGKGLMIGVEMDFPVSDILPRLRDEGYLCGPAGPNVLRFLPPLIIDEENLFGVLRSLDEILSKQNR
ncbi:acetylornithine transaminase [bacterium]|nr:acetylornithine transaminase [bacterium]